MAVTIQIKRGVQANTPTLAQGEFYFATDTRALYLGVGDSTNIQIGDTSGVNETLQQLLAETRAMRRALVEFVCEGGRAEPMEFDPAAADAEKTLQG